MKQVTTEERRGASLMNLCAERDVVYLQQGLSGGEMPLKSVFLCLGKSKKGKSLPARP
jgi:hypothetical protein